MLLKCFFMGYKIYGVIVIPIHAISYKKGETLDFMSLLSYSDNYGIFPLGMMGGIIGCSIDISIV